jgi:hypothetical protein
MYVPRLPRSTAVTGTGYGSVLSSRIFGLGSAGRLADHPVGTEAGAGAGPGFHVGFGRVLQLAAGFLERELR